MDSISPGKAAVFAILSVSLAFLLAGAPLSAGYARATVEIKGKVFRVDLAQSQSQQSLGLGGRKRLGPLEGMLFLYSERDQHTFWMKGMVIAIDIIWLDNNRVVHIEHQVPPPVPGTPLTMLPTYASPTPANAVLEIASGRARALGLSNGDFLNIRFE